MEIMEQAKRQAAASTGARRGKSLEKLADPRDLFLSELADVYYAEKALEKVLPKLAEEASDGDLSKGFERHLIQTKKHAVNLETIFERLGKAPKAEMCPGIEGIKQEHDKFMTEHETTPEIRDIFLTGAAARAEHYEIAAYTGLVTKSRALGETQVTRLLESNLRDEKAQLKNVEAVSKRLSNGSNGRKPAARQGGQRTRATKPAAARKGRTTRSSR
jgi:ferritin-like metal-binding protein YciE